MFNIKNIIIILIIFFIYIYNKKLHLEYYIDMIDTKKSNIHNIIDSIYIITIPSRINNVTLFSKSFDYNTRIFDALLIKNFIDYNNKYNLKIGEIACASSHISVLNKFVKSKKNNILIFEDDLIHYTNKYYNNILEQIEEVHLNNYIYNAYKSLPSDWDLLYLGRCWDDCDNHQIINKYIIKTKRALCNHAILYSKKGANILLKNISHPLEMPIDHIIANLSVNNILNCYATIIPLFFQNRNDIETSIGNYDHLPTCL